MALFPLFRRQAAAEAASDASAAEQVQQARARARQRLLGAVLLLGVGIVAFPLLFETEPRPMPADVTIEIPPKDAVPPLAVPSAPSAETVAAAGVQPGVPVEAPAPATTAQASEPAAKPLEQSPKPPEPTTRAAEMPPAPAEPAPKPAEVAPKPAPSDGERALALLEGRVAPPTDGLPSAGGGSRYIVQVGAFADRLAAQKARQRVEQLGLKTYTQVVETADGPRTRVRVGPFGSRDDADKAAAQLKSAGLAAAVLTL